MSTANSTIITELYNYACYLLSLVMCTQVHTCYNHGIHSSSANRVSINYSSNGSCHK